MYVRVGGLQLDQGQGVMQACHAAIAAALLLPGVVPLTPCAFCCLLLHRLLLGGRSPALQTHIYTHITQPQVVSTHTREPNSHLTIRMCCSSHAARPAVQAVAAFCCVTPGSPDSCVSIQQRQADQVVQGQTLPMLRLLCACPYRLPACPERHTPTHSPLSRGSALGSVV